MFERKLRQKERLCDAFASHPHGQHLKRPEASIAEIGGWVRQVLGEEPVRGLLSTVETEVKYSGYISQQERQMERMKDAERRAIPPRSASRAYPGFPARSSPSWSGWAGDARPSRENTRGYAGRNREF